MKKDRKEHGEMTPSHLCFSSICPTFLLHLSNFFFFFTEIFHAYKS